MENLLEYGYAGLFIGAFLAATIIPFSSDVLLVGLLAAGGDPFISVAVATLGNWLGGLTSYWLGRVGKWEWIERWLHVSREKLERQKSKIDRYGSLMAFLSWLPFVGDILAVGLGFYRTPFTRSAIFMLLGKGARFVMWAAIFYWIKPLFAQTAMLF